MWHEVEKRQTYSREDKPQLEITKKRQLKPGDEVIISLERSGFLGRNVDSITSVRILDEDNLMVVSRKLRKEPPITAGPFMAFPRSAKDTLRVTRQDVKSIKGQKVKGVLWTNEAGTKPELLVSTQGRDFYVTDTDLAADEMREQVARFNAQFAEGKITGGAGGSGGWH